jgi:hypothetical protein
LEEIRDELREHASLECPFCHGTGVDLEPVSDRPVINWCNANAVAMLRVLGLPDQLYGSMSIPMARRAVIRARSRVDLTGFIRAEQVVYGRPQQHGAVVEFRPVWGLIFGLSAEQIAERIEAFACFVEDSVAKGATEVSWA